MDNKDIENKYLKAIERELSNLTDGKFEFEVRLEDDGMGIYAVEYYQMQDRGVSGTKKKFNTPFQYKDKMPPPSAFSKYTGDKSKQFAIAKSIQTKGIKPHKYFEAIENSDKLSKLIEDAYEHAVEEEVYNQIT